MKPLSTVFVRLDVHGLCLIVALAAACSSNPIKLHADAGTSGSGGSSTISPDAPAAPGGSGGSPTAGGVGGAGGTSVVGRSGGTGASDAGVAGSESGGWDALRAAGGAGGRGGPVAAGGTGISDGRIAAGGLDARDAPVATGGAAGGHGSDAGDAGNGWVSLSIPVSLEREVDILFMVDNSPSMDPTQTRLAQNFPRMIQVLQTIPDGNGGTSLPDLHMGVISSDMGAGSDSIGTNCRRVLGDRGLLYGNDPNNPLASVAPTADPDLGGHPQSNGCGLHSGQRWISDVADPNGSGRRIRNYDGNIEDVFACLAKAVGTGGCGFEHQLQSVRVALNADYPNNPKDAPNTINPENIGFVRPRSYLAIVLITNEDDCSADPDDAVNDSMFLQTQGIPTEAASLRCAARGHVCNGFPIPGYDAPSIGYQPPNPLPAPNVGFSTAFANCAAKDQIDPNHPDHHYLPLIRVQDMIESVNGVTAWVVDGGGNYVYDASGYHVSVQKTPDKILVTGIIGWPPDTSMVGVTTSDQYQIGIDTTSLPAPQNAYWDYMPICMIPSIESADGNIYKAYGGLRLRKFIDAFQKTDANGSIQNTFSLCNADFTITMTKIANAITPASSLGCVQYPLIDADPNTPGVQPNCQAIERVPCDAPAVGTCLASGYQENPLPECKDPSSGLPLDPANPRVGNVPYSALPCWYLYYDTSATGCPGAYMGQRIAVLQQAMTTAPAGTLLVVSCLTSTAAAHGCPAQAP